jgi:predicted nuclease of predicted toxin-antitoxin system
MRFLVDAQLPRRLAVWLNAEGCDSIHTLDLPASNRTTDQLILEIADKEQRAVITESWRLRGFPRAFRATCETVVNNNRQHHKPHLTGVNDADSARNHSTIPNMFIP